jgi:hypothetical protein
MSNKFLTRLIVLCCFASCSIKKDFKKTYEKYDQLNLPQVFTSRTFYKPKSDTNMDSAAVHGAILGRLFESQNYYAVINLVPIETFTPELLTLDKNGEYIDRFQFFRSPGGEPGFRSIESVIISVDKSLVFTDSTQQWDFVDSTMKEIDGTRKLEILREKYKINDSGKIVRVE